MKTAGVGIVYALRPPQCHCLEALWPPQFHPMLPPTNQRKFKMQRNFEIGILLSLTMCMQPIPRPKTTEPKNQAKIIVSE